MVQRSPFIARVVGQGPPVVLLPGVALSDQLWDSVVPRYGSQFELHLLTPAGFGAAPPIEHRPLLPLFRQHFLDYLSRIAPPRVVIAHSFGAHLALCAAVASCAERLLIIDGLPELGPVFFPECAAEDRLARAQADRERRLRYSDAESVFELLKAFRSLFRHEENFTRMAPQIGESDPATVTDLLFELATARVEDLSQIAAHVLLLIPDLSRYSAAIAQSRRDEYRRQYASIRDHRIEEIAGSNHFPMFDVPNAFFERCDQFLSGH